MKREYPLGECQLKYTLDNGSPLILGLTLKEDETIFSSNIDIYKIEVDQLTGPYRAFYVQGETTFKCSCLLNIDMLEKLIPIYEKGKMGYAMSTAGKEVKFGKLEIHPVSAGTKTDYDIIGPKVLCKAEIQIEYKKEGKAKCKLTFEFASDEKRDSPTYKKIFTIGKYKDGTFVRFRNKNLILVVKDGEKIPNLKIKNKKLIYSSSPDELVDFKIQNKHLIKTLK